MIYNSITENLQDLSIEETLTVGEDGAPLVNITIPANGYYLLSEESIAIGKLSMGANSAIVINPNLRFCKITVDRAYILADATIGVEGVTPSDAPKNKDPWDSGWWQASKCAAGVEGVSGINGADGQHGITIELKIGINTLGGKLTVISKGGNGSRGSSGGQGQLGGNRNTPFCGSGKGGDGGNGGHGGNGGNGGDVVVRYFKNDDFDGQIVPLSKGGAGAAGGKGGGLASGGNNSNPGRNGSTGKTGKNGTDSLVHEVHLIPKP